MIILTVFASAPVILIGWKECERSEIFNNRYWSLVNYTESIFNLEKNAMLAPRRNGPVITLEPFFPSGLLKTKLYGEAPLEVQTLTFFYTVHTR